MLPIETLVGIPICLAHSGPAPRVQRALYLLVCRQVTQFAPNLPHADGSRLRPLARGQRWSGPRTYPGQVHCLGRPLVVSLRWTPVGGRPCSSVRRRRCPGLRAFLSSPPPARASVSSATQSAHCPPTNRTHRRPAAPPPPNRPALLAFPPHLPTGRTCEHKAEHAGPPTAESLPERCKRKPWPPPSCRSPLSPHPRPLVVTGHLTSSPVDDYVTSFVIGPAVINTHTTN